MLWTAQTMAIESAWRMPVRYRASGALYSARSPAAGAVLTFNPLNVTLPVYPQAQVDGDGRFEVRTPYFGLGAPEAEYAVTVAWSVLGCPTYADVHRTPLRVHIVAQWNHLPSWVVSRRSLPVNVSLFSHLKEPTHVL